MAVTTSTRPLLDASAARPLQWWSPPQHEALAQRLQPLWSEWTGEWLALAPSGDAPVRCRAAHDEPALAGRGWTRFGARGEASAWVAGTDGPVARVEEVMFSRGQGAAAGPATTGVASAVASTAWGELARRLRESLSLDLADEPSASPEASTFTHWSGSVVVTLHGAAGTSLSILLNGASVLSLLPSTPATPSPSDKVSSARPSLTRLDGALAARKLPIRVELVGCELDLGSLQGLRVGDVIPLAHPLDAPLLVSIGQGTPLCVGFLGRQAGAKAIELVREPAAPDTHEPTLNFGKA
jgi:hypothetical protein